MLDTTFLTPSRPEGGLRQSQRAAMANQIASYVLVALLCLLGLVLHGAEARLETHVPAVFVFGDSTVDVGNNNYLDRTLAKVNFPHYGVDFPLEKPTGRFSNGFNTADQLAQLLGFPLSPPAYLSLIEGSLIFKMRWGINFASGGSGLLQNTGRLVDEVIPMSTQVEYFSSVVDKMNKLSGPRRTANFLSKSIFFISTGSNDLFEYSLYPRNDTEFLLGLVASYKNHLKELYGLGARKFSIVSIPLVGCCPSQRARRLSATGTEGCFDPLNDVSKSSYPMIAAMLQELSFELPGMTYSLGDAVAMVSAIVANPRTNEWDFRELEAGCCGSGPYGESGCNQTSPLCSNRDDHLFWDAYHPSQVVSGIAAKMLFRGDRTFVSPINVRELAML